MRPMNATPSVLLRFTWGEDRRGNAAGGVAMDREKTKSGKGTNYVVTLL